MLWLLTYSQYNEYIIAKLRFVLFRIILRNQVFVLKLTGLLPSSLIQRRTLIPDWKNSYPKVLKLPVRYGQLLSKRITLLPGRRFVQVGNSKFQPICSLLKKHLPNYHRFTPQPYLNLKKKHFSLLQIHFYCYICPGQVFYDQLLLNSPRSGTKQG